MIFLKWFAAFITLALTICFLYTFVLDLFNVWMAGKSIVEEKNKKGVVDTKNRKVTLKSFLFGLIISALWPILIMIW